MSKLEKCANTIGLSVLLLISCGIGLADEVTDWNHIMLEATLTPPGNARAHFNAEHRHCTGCGVRCRERHRPPVHAYSCLGRYRRHTLF
jgi:hypothetical protein